MRYFSLIVVALLLLASACSSPTAPAPTCTRAPSAVKVTCSRQ